MVFSARIKVQTMNINITSKMIGSWSLIFAPVILLIFQQITGLIPLRQDTADPAVFTFLCIFFIALGYGIQGISAQGKFIHFLLAFGVLNLIPLISNLLAASGSKDIQLEYLEFGILTPWYVMGIQIGTYALVFLQVLALSVPISIFIISTFKMLSIKHEESNFTSGVIEIIVMIIILVIACLGYGFLGLSYTPLQFP